MRAPRAETKPMTAEKLREFLAFATAISREAGKITLKYFRRQIEVERKADLSPVTVADRETESFIRKAIRETYPDHGLLGEEHGEVESTSGYKWIVDPIDGTKSFIHGIPLYTVLIALLKDGEPLVGVIHNPPLGETAAAAAGLGCTLNGKPCSVSPVAELKNARIQITDPADLMQRYPAFARTILEQAPFCRTWGDGYGYLLVASGRAEVMLDPVLSPWDVAPLKVIITEAGGKLTDFSGRSAALPESAVAANGELHAEVLRLFT